MSRGLGKIERQILAALSPTEPGVYPGRTVPQIARVLAGLSPYGLTSRELPRGLRESVYRAIRSLARKGLVCRKAERRIKGGELWTLAGTAAAEAEAKRKRDQREERKRRKQEEEFEKLSAEYAERTGKLRPDTTRLAAMLGRLGSDSAGERERRRSDSSWPSRSVSA
jgi:hypothetical protein